MDPISLAASIITVVGATGKIAAGFEKLCSSRDIPEEVIFLMNEVRIQPCSAASCPIYPVLTVNDSGLLLKAALALMH